MQRRTVILTPMEDKSGGYTAEVPSLPGCISEGDTRDLALANISEAIEGYIESRRERGLPVPEEPTSIEAVELLFYDSELEAPVELEDEMVELHVTYHDYRVVKFDMTEDELLKLESAIAGRWHVKSGDGSPDLLWFWYENGIKFGAISPRSVYSIQTTIKPGE